MEIPIPLSRCSRVIYFNGTSLDITSPRIIGSYWRCVLKVKFYLRDQDIALILNVIQDQNVWTHRVKTTNRWTEYIVPIGQINGIFKVQIQFYRIKQIRWKRGKLQNAVFENCDLSSVHSEKQEPGLSKDTFVCRTGVIIRSDQLCDFHDNCFHGDDESEEICGNGFSLGLCDFEEITNCSLILRDYMESTSTVEDANVTVALTDGTGSLKGHVLAFEERQNAKKTGFVTVNLTQPESYLANNKSCVFQVDTYSTVNGGRFRLIVHIIDAETEEILKKDETNLPLYEWQIYRQLIPDFSERNVSTFYLVVYTVLSNGYFLGFDNIYISSECIAKDTPATFSREIPEESNVVMIVTVSCASMGFVWISILLLMYMRYTKIPQTGKSRKRLSLFGARSRSVKGVPDSAPLLRRLNENLWQDHPNYHMYKQILTQDLSDDIKNLSRYKLKLTKVLGSGAFGEVLQGQLIRGVIFKHVAVKRLSSGCSEKERTDFLVEALTMSKFKHDNIVCCLGIYVKNGALLLVEELMAGGDLKHFLVESRPTIDETPALSTDELLSLANDICQACSYLEAHKFIHRDIASRNCLLTAKTPDRVAKMADFGLARDIIQNDSYQKCGRSMLPVRWLPPESYLEGIFSTKSDVWAYGILLWEIFSFGYDPYPSMKCEEMMAKVNGGQRMAAPSRCPTVVYDVMMLCWQHDPKSRPSFERLCEYLQKIRKNVCINIVCTNDVSGDEQGDDRVESDEENKLHTWHCNGNYAIEEESV
ncbi:Leukocyte tyrosine kinase receptor [Mizuhopecten yessoensis]|uniref:Leukocyte tyrosine kinase receptor n=1 Tax=Mizuhopecten yessoensis TaxID=6573 RepID=A0A210PXZ8_MIZYE|nr:Leukocyte tyrosine kinase receptor [Mizuhopecten yessoensis]